MTVFPSYSTGTVSVTASGTTVTGVSTVWSGVNAIPGDILQIGNFQTIISDVTDATTLVIPPYGGTTVSGVAYKIWKTSPLRFAGGQAAADVSTLVAALNTDGFYVFVGPSLTVPDPSYGNDNQFAFQPTTGKLWLKTGGTWVLQPSLSVGVRMAYSTTTSDADPGAGIFRLNNATPASATAAYLDNVDSNGVTVSGIWDQFDDSTSTVRGIVRFQKATDPTVWAQFNVTGSVVNGTGYRKLTLASGVASGSFTNTDAFVVTFYRTGDIGTTGPQGTAAGVRQAYSTTTSDADPGAGTFRLNNATPASATAAYLDNLDAGGAIVSGLWDLMDDSTNTVRGTFRAQKSTDPTVWAQWNVTGSVVDGTGYRKLTLANGAGSGAFTNGDTFSFTFQRSGDASGVSSIASNTGAFTLGRGLTNSTNELRVDMSLLRNYIAGLTLSTAGASTTVSIAAGVAMDSTNVDLIKLASGISKSMSANWSVGNAGGFLDTGSASAGYYHVYLMKRPDTGVVDVCCSASASAPTTGGAIPSAYTIFRRIGTLSFTGTAWTKFVQFGDEFLLDTRVNDVNGAATSATAASQALSVPTGIVVEALFTIRADYSSGAVAVLITSLYESNQSATTQIQTVTTANGAAATSSLRIRTNTSAQIRIRSSGTGSVIYLTTYGWVDRRGKDA